MESLAKRESYRSHIMPETLCAPKATTRFLSCDCLKTILIFTYKPPKFFAIFAFKTNCA